MIDANYKEHLKSISPHPIGNTFYEAIGLGGNPRGILHGMTPGEPLHVLKLGSTVT